MGLSYALISLTITTASKAVWFLNQARMQLCSNFSRSLGNNDLCYLEEEEEGNYMHRRQKHGIKRGRETRRSGRRFSVS
jgi:hypothetical protein